MNKNETDLKDKVREMLNRRYGRNVWFWKVNDNFTSHIPDFIICFYGRFVAIELKNGNNKLSDGQKYTVERIREANGFAFGAWDVHEVESSLENIRQII